jgi:hypothetical protein
MQKMKLGALVGLLFGVTQATAADASTGYSVEGVVTSVAVTDTFSNNDGSTDVVLELTFNTAGNECGNARAIGAAYTINKAQAPGGFDTFVKTAQSAYLSGRTLRYQSLRTSSTVCRPQFMLLK